MRAKIEQTKKYLLFAQVPWLVGVAVSLIVAAACGSDAWLWAVICLVSGTTASVIVTVGIVSWDSRVRVMSRMDHHRKKASRHEWIQETALERLDTQAEIIRGDTPGAAQMRDGGLSRRRGTPPVVFSPPVACVPRVLFVTSNGGGLGHVNRCLAIARASEDLFSSTVITLSSAYEKLRDEFPWVSHFPSPADSECPRQWWNRMFTRTLTDVIYREGIDAVVFDGVAVYSAVTDACGATLTPLVWTRRGLWKKSAGRPEDAPIHRAVDAIIIPGERGDATQKRRDRTYEISPVVIDRYGALSRDEACAELGLDVSGRYCLVQPGTVSRGRELSAAEEVVACLGSADPGLTPVLLRSPLSDAPVPQGCVVVAPRFPFSPFLAAFDVTVSAAGYNTAHEVTCRGVPTLFVPNRDTPTDDQVRRAHMVAAKGRGVVVDVDDDMAEGVARLVDAQWQASAREALSMVRYRDGARQAGEIIAERIARHRARQPVLTTSVSPRWRDGAT